MHAHTHVHGSHNAHSHVKISANNGELPRFFQMPSDEVLWKTSWDLYLGYFLNIRRVEKMRKLVEIPISAINTQQL